MLLSSFYKFFKVLKYPDKLLQENTTSQNIFTVFFILFLEELLNNTELGVVNFTTLQEATVQKTLKYTKSTDENQQTIWKYASEHRKSATVHHFKKDSPNITESTVREFKKKYEKQLQKAKKQNRSKNTPQRQDDHCFQKNLISRFKTTLKG